MALTGKKGENMLQRLHKKEPNGTTGDNFRNLSEMPGPWQKFPDDEKRQRLFCSEFKTSTKLNNTCWKDTL